MDPHRITREERMVKVGGTEVKLTDLELRLEAVAYPVTPPGAIKPQTHYADPAEVLASTRPPPRFPVSPAVYRSMRERARRIQALLAGEEKSHISAADKFGRFG